MLHAIYLVSFLATFCIPTKKSLESVPTIRYELEMSAVESRLLLRWYLFRVVGTDFGKSDLFRSRSDPHALGHWCIFLLKHMFLLLVWFSTLYYAARIPPTESSVHLNFKLDQQCTQHEASIPF